MRARSNIDGTLQTEQTERTSGAWHLFPTHTDYNAMIAEHDRQKKKNQVYRLGATCLTCTLAYLDQNGATATRAHSLMMNDDYYCIVAGARMRAQSILVAK